MKNSKLEHIQLGAVVAIRFLDHCEDAHKDEEEGPIEFVTYGKIANIGETFFSVDCWCYADGHDRDHNVKSFTIVKSAILEIKILGSLT